MANNIQQVEIGKIRPYEHNPRDNSEAIPKVAESIRQFGFLNPIIVDGDGIILAGHTRYAAAKSLGMTEVPVVYATTLTAEQARAFRLADNKTAEFSKWDNVFLADELEALAGLEVDMSVFDFDVSELWRRQQAWKQVVTYCNLKKRVKHNSHGDFFSVTFFESNKKGDGADITAIKTNPENVAPFADCLVDYVLKTLGSNLAAGGWCMMTTPRRRHKNFHFSTTICATAAKALSMTFYEDAVTAKNRNRIEPEFELAIDPPERNVLLVDDIISTGETIRTTRRLLLDAGHTVLAIAAIRNS